MEPAPLLVTTEGPVALVTINRPAVHNALNREVLTRLAETVRALDAAPSTRAIVLTGAGDRAFSAGADLDELTGLDAVGAMGILSAGQADMAAVAASGTPVIAAVNGLALGGGFELTLACTFPVLSTRASLRLPETGLGLIPGYGGTQRLPRLIGRAAAAHLMLTGGGLSPERAHQLGLSPMEPVAPDELLPTAREIAARIAERGPQATRSVLRALHTGAPAPCDLDLESALAASATSSDEAAEGVAAFLEKRPPAFAATAKEAVR